MFSAKMLIHKVFHYDYRDVVYQMDGHFVSRSEYYELSKTGNLKMVQECKQCDVRNVFDINEFGVVINRRPSYC